MAITRHLVDVLKSQKGWKPYIKGYWLDFNKQRGGVIITFKGHESFEYKCSYKVAEEITE